jgi:hypothetical protein
MRNDAQPDLSTNCLATGRYLTAHSGSRRPIGHRAGARPAQSPVTYDQHELEAKELLADILACIFAEALDTGKLDRQSRESVSPQQSNRVKR